jgi:hypothetical protein
MSWGYSPEVSISRARGLILSCASRRTVSVAARVVQVGELEVHAIQGTANGVPSICSVATFRTRASVAPSMADSTYDVVVDRRGHDRGGRRARRASRGLKRRPDRQRRHSPRAPVRSLPKWSTAAFAICSKESSGWSMRTCANVNDSSRTRRSWCAPPLSHPLFGRNGVASKASGEGLRHGASNLRTQRRLAHWTASSQAHRARGARVLPIAQHRSPRRRIPLLRRRGDDARVALTLARSAALDFDADVANVRALRRHSSTTPRGRVSGCAAATKLDDSRPSRSRPGRRQRHGRVGRRDLHDGRGHKTSHRITPAKGVHLSGAARRVSRRRGRGAERAGRSAKHLHRALRRRTVHLHRHDGHGTTTVRSTSPECTPEDVAYLLNAVNASTSSNLTTATSPASGPAFDPCSRSGWRAKR